MTAPETATRRRFTVDEYYRMADVALLHLPHGMDAIPGPDAARLIVEVADTTLAHDRRKATRSGQAGVPETWIVVLEDDAIEVYRQPGADGYAKQQRVQPGDVLSCAALPGLAAFAVEALLCPPALTTPIPTLMPGPPPLTAIKRTLHKHRPTF